MTDEQKSIDEQIAFESAIDVEMGKALHVAMAAGGDQRDAITEIIASLVRVLGGGAVVLDIGDIVAAAIQGAALEAAQDDGEPKH